MGRVVAPRSLVPFEACDKLSAMPRIRPRESGREPLEALIKGTDPTVVVDYRKLEYKQSPLHAGQP